LAASARRVDVTDTPTRLSTPPSDSVAGAALDVHNPAGSGDTVDLGGPAVATGAGYALAPGESKAMTFMGDDELWAVAPAAQTVTVHVLELGI
jgi:hypothetical protein